MLDKLLLNNQLLANKKLVQKVKVNIINKLVHKIRRIKKMSEKYPDNKKFNIKLQKDMEILSIVKKTNNLKILRLALINDKNPNSVITNGLSLPEEVAQAMFFIHKTIKDIVKRLQEMFQLDPSKTDWKEQVTELSKRKKKDLRTENKKQKRLERKARNEITRKRNEWLEENIPVGENGEVTTVVEEPNDSEVEADISNIKESHSDTPVVPKVKMEKKKPEKPKPVQPESPSLPSDHEEEIVTAVDPFFLTQTGTNYVSTAVIDRVQPEAPNDGLVRKERRAQNFQQRQYGARNYGQKNGRNNDRFRNNKLQSAVPLKTFTETRKRPIESAKESTNDLHPSWAAKQKQKSIQTFQGTKIKFGETGDSEIKASPGNTEKLHPSWEAKQKLKPAIAEFKGSKIVFDDD